MKRILSCIVIVLTSLSLLAQTDEPSFSVTPAKGGSATCSVGDSVLVQTYTICRHQLTAPVTLEVLGTHRSQWSLSTDRVTTDTATVRLYYRPTAPGNHRGTLFVDCTAAPTSSCTFSLSGSATEPGTTPAISLMPNSLPTFRCVEGQTLRDTIRVNATHCTDYVNISLTNDEMPGAFSVNNLQMPANVQNGLSIVSFHPLSAGTYHATLAYSTAGGETRTVTLYGEAQSREHPLEYDYDTVFCFADTDAHTYIEEHFSEAGHNTPLELLGWQNVVRGGQRGWWSLDRANDEDFYCAKATAFVSGLTDTTTWDMWLVTPPLDYPHTDHQVFSFRVRGDYLYDEQPTALSLYYIDATDTNDVWMQVLEVPIPRTKDEKGEWMDIEVNLGGQTTIADVFYMAFRYVGPGGIDGAPTYYIDDVVWGEPATDVHIQTSSARATKRIEQGRVVLLQGEKKYEMR